MVNILKEKPLISVIVPVYNTEKFLKKCLESIQNQTYKNLEIILVDDASPDKCSEIMDAFVSVDSRFKVVTHTENRGLFQARLTGVDSSNGNFIAFVDSDDYISVDWFRLLLKKAVDTGADMVVGDLLIYKGNIPFEKEPYLEYYNLDPVRLRDFSLNQSQMIAEMKKTGFYSKSFRLIQNKLFNKKVFDSTSLNRLSCVENLKDCDFILLLTLINSCRLCKNVHDVFYIYNCDKNEFPLYSHKTFLSIVSYLELILRENYNYVTQEVINFLLEKTASRSPLLLDTLKSKFGKSFSVHAFNCNYDLESLKTSVGFSFHNFEEAKMKMLDPRTKYVSFDIFDTLISRNLLEPVDLFHFLDKKFNQLISTNTYCSFTNIRKIGEAQCRKKMSKNNRNFEEITIDEIYLEIIEILGIHPDIANEIKEYEKELEKQFCVERKSGKDLYDLAVFLDKEIIFISDMYLDKGTILEILNKNGYYGELFLSSDIRLGKYTGSLQRYVLSELQLVETENILHFGDNWISDIENFRTNGIIAYHLPKPLDIFMELNPAIYGGDLFQKIWGKHGTAVDTSASLELFHGFRCILSLSINKYYDSPYLHRNNESDFNANPAFIGYFCLGAHILALTKWLYDETVNKYEKIHFLARDGYLPYEAYKIMYSNNENALDIDYTYISRYTIILCDIKKKEDFFSLPSKLDVKVATPKKIFDLFDEILRSDIDLDSFCRKIDLRPKGQFTSEQNFYKFLNHFIYAAVDFNKLENYHKQLEMYYKQIFKMNECFFDIGYNGRVENALGRICQYPIDGYYVHAHTEMAYLKSYSVNAKVSCFYNYQPTTTFLIREQIMSKLDASVRKISFKENDWQLVFSEIEECPVSDFVTELMQIESLQMITDFNNIFGDFEYELPVRTHDLSIMFEYFLNHSSYFDRKIFESTLFENNFGEDVVFNLCDFWQNHLINANTMERNLTKTVYIDNGIAENGIIMLLFNKTNKFFPKGSKRREFIKKILKFFVK